VSSSPTDQSSPASGTVAVDMPQMGVSVAEGTIVEWHKRPGDWVAADECVCIVTTDKIDVEIPSPATGRLERILVEPGDTVSVGTPLAEIDAAARPGEAHPEEEDTDGAGMPVPPASAAEDRPDRSEFHSPVVRRMAAEHGIDLGAVRGTGVGGRIRKRDLQALVENGGAAKEPAHERPLHSESPYRPEPEPDAAAPAQAGGRREPMTPMRKLIAKHMLESRRTSAHCTTIVEADFGRVAAARAERKQEMGRRGVSLTYLAFAAVATVEALQRHPVLNASVEGEEIVHHDDVNLGIAVALESGLIVPVIERAQRLSLEGMAAAIGERAERARAGTLSPDDVHGGTFTITNPGQFGAVLATPIINQPQVAILDLEAVVKRPVVVDGEAGESIAIRPMTNLCMSWDHRALDGAEAARFLADVKKGLETWGGTS
jgi:pyruvate/2-oxoglutarate dehydrogenase complex dihydrolipoamide acyltransferase (E2) component